MRACTRTSEHATHQTELRVQILAVLLHVTADVDCLLDEEVQILRDLGGETCVLERSTVRLTLKLPLRVAHASMRAAKVNTQAATAGEAEEALASMASRN